MKNTKIQHIIQRYLNEQHLFSKDPDPLATSGEPDEIEVFGWAQRSGWDFRIVGEKNIISNFRADVVDRRAVENGAVAGFLVVATTKGKEQQQLDGKDLFASIVDLAKQSNVIKQYYDNTKYQFVVSSPIVDRKTKKTFNVWIVDISVNSAYGQLLSIIKRLYKQDPMAALYIDQGGISNLPLKQSRVITQKLSIFQTRALEQFIETLKQKSPELYNQVFPPGSKTKKILSSIPNFKELDKQFEDLPLDIKTGQLVDLDDKTLESGFSGKGRYDIDPVTGLARIVPIDGKISFELYDTYTNQRETFIGQIKDGLPVSGIIEFSGVYPDLKRSKFDGTLNAQRNEKGELEAWFESGKLYLRNETDEEAIYFESSTTNGFSKQGDTLNGTWWQRKSPTDPYEKVAIEINGKYRAAKQLTYPYTTNTGYTYYTTTQSASYVYNFYSEYGLWKRYDKTKFENFKNGEGSAPDGIIETDPEILADLDRQASTTSKKPLEIKDGLTKINLFKKQGNEFKFVATYTVNPPSDTKYLPDANGRSGNYVSALFKNNNKYIDLWIQKTDLK